ncbi:ArsO family NAD(P)H-dependent flavin-containing monooxygenase [Reichenbachiella carrageenanivorans]|uniref:ArsO family NAD(P)H-dependent flavin-containing monooxygenase n=1 Tax=Reichenbachiella carrageenanivorans TaxID=2979869 RepID=A0ABY6D0G2_9BACT|nr:ArsO family NAD(P)H-dependent flavin-containing monooxygenase [Reichenbachiella carrageenanivorans]UXX79189.1 ArsO family NAD(P)H-dependent flavin-containing monooxygenase [Reichenbachiella carrageenanivorans]
MKETFDTIVIGGGQSGLACGYYLRRAKLNFLIIDKQQVAGGAWLNAWDSLTLFSPADYSSLPGWLMPKSENKFPLKKEVIDYLSKYEAHYQLNVKRGVETIQITKDNSFFQVHSNQGIFKCKTIISATGTWENPFIPKLKGLENFKGLQIHSRNYKNPDAFVGLKTLVVGEGNSGAQIVAETSKVTTVKWSTKRDPEFLPDEVDGYYLFNVATAKYKAEKEGKPFDASQYNLGNIVMVPPVKEARKRGVLVSSGSFHKLTKNGVVWDSGMEEEFDAIIWCTGFGYATDYLKSLVKTDERGIAKTQESRSLEVDGLWLVGYGGWTGYASATLVGLNRTAKQTIKEIEEYFKVYS